MHAQRSQSLVVSKPRDLRGRDQGATGPSAEVQAIISRAFAFDTLMNSLPEAGCVRSRPTKRPGRGCRVLHAQLPPSAGVGPSQPLRALQQQTPHAIQHAGVARLVKKIPPKSGVATPAPAHGSPHPHSSPCQSRPPGLQPCLCRRERAGPILFTRVKKEIGCPHRPVLCRMCGGATAVRVAAVQCGLSCRQG